MGRKLLNGPRVRTVDSKRLEDGPQRIYAGVPLGLEDTHIPTFWLLLYIAPRAFGV